MKDTMMSTNKDSSWVRTIGQMEPFGGDPHGSHSAWSSMRTGIFFM